ncbi:MAG TPA: fused MFS/spermidine synthase [Thermoanaerobaculia bacterium]
MKSRLVRVALLLFGSGLSSLIYQVAWMRDLRLVFGFSTAASAAVVAIFLGGLGLGSRVLGRVADRAERPLELYGKLELGIAASAAVTPGLLWLIRAAYLALGGSVTMGLIFGSVVRLVLSALVLLVPTFLMGGTLPAASRAVETDDDADRRRMAVLYGANTIGAVAGTALSTFWLLEALGTRETLWAGCVFNALIGLAAVALGRKIVIHDAAAPAQEAPAAIESPAAPRSFVLAASCIVGFAFTLMELVWYRMLTPLLGGSTYTFGLILAVALAGIGLGAAAYGRVSRGRPATLTALSATTALEAVCLALPFAAGDRIALFAALSRPLGAYGFSGYILTWTQVTVLVVLPAALVAGFQFPQLVGLLGRGSKGVGEDVGLAYAWNTLGAIGGSLAGGFGLLPILYATGSWKAVILMLAVLSAWTLWLARRDGAAARRNGSPAGRSDAWLPLAGIAASIAMLFATGPTSVWRHSPIGAGRVHLETSAPNDVVVWERDQRRLVAWDADGRESAVALLKTRGGAAFVINGKVDGNSREDAATQVMSGMVGAALHPHVKNALVIGLGTGSTAGWLGTLPTIERVDVAELEAAVLGVARDCAPVNRGVLANTKVHITIGDARELLLTTRRRYDLVFSEPSNPYRAGISSLFTQDFYKAVKDRLEPGGIFVQWLQAYEVDPQTVRTVYATLGSVFGSVETFSGKNDDLLLVSTEKPIRWNADALRERLAEEPFTSAMQDAWRVVGLEGFLSHYVARDSLTRSIVRAEAGRVNRDDKNVVEFAFARSLGQGGLFQGDELRVLSQARGENRPAIEGPPPDWNRVRWNAVVARTEESLQPPQPASVDDVPRLTAHSAYLAGDLRQVLNAYASAPWEPEGPLEIAMIAEAMADGGQETALDWIAKLRPYQPAEADAILARYLWSQGRFQECYQACAAAMGRYRVDPWPLSSIMGRYFAILGDLPARDAKLAPLIYDLLTPPLPLWLLDDERNLMRLYVGHYLGTARAAEALEPLEPHFPWRRDLLEDRAKIYEEIKHPRAELARRELELFDRKVPTAFEQGLQVSAPAP